MCKWLRQYVLGYVRERGGRFSHLRGRAHMGQAHVPGLLLSEMGIHDVIFAIRLFRDDYAKGFAGRRWGYDRVQSKPWP